MTTRLLAVPAVAGIFLVVGGCSGLRQQPEPQAGYAMAEDHGDATSTGVIRLATFEELVEEPVESSPADSPDLAPVQSSDHPTPATFESGAIFEAPEAPFVLEAVEAESTAIDLDLTEALAMAVGQNPRIAFAAARYREAYARLESAQTLWLPSLRAGLSYYHHDGSLQPSGGQLLDVSRSSLQTGLGVRAVGTGLPAVPGVAAEFHASDAVFQPKIAGQAAFARDAAAEATTNDTLLATALAYLDLLRETQQLRIAEATRDNAENLTQLTARFVSSGWGSPADEDRVRTELVRRRIDVSRAQESTRVASARLAELLSLDPSIEVKPREPTIVRIDLVSHEQPSADLVATGLANRPELAEAQYLVCEAIQRYRREKYAPLLPSVLLGVSQSDFGAGPGSDVDNDRGRFDFDATVYWELRNFGWGERAKRNETRSRYDQARALQVSVMDRVAREVVEAQVQAQTRDGQIDVAQSGVESATNSYERNLTRIREGQGLPIEVLQSLQALDEARRQYLRTLVDYNESQFRLQRALGWPIQ